jgi:hypothetical protein
MYVMVAKVKNKTFDSSFFKYFFVTTIEQFISIISEVEQIDEHFTKKFLQITFV